MLRHRPAILALPALAIVLAAGLALQGCRSPGDGRREVKHASRPQPRPLATPTRAVWVARFHYRYVEDIPTIMENCARAGFNTVYLQVRGEGTVSYPSRSEPWGREYGHVSPGFDPLALAVMEAHRHGLRIEAWVNVMPGWKGPEPPPAGLDPLQLYHAHPDWFLSNADGNRQPLVTVDAKTKRKESFYVILNPCLPEVRAHIAGVIDEILTHYDVDGVHLDYIRYAWDTTENAKRDFPRDPRTLALYEQDTGLRPDDDTCAWNGWRANQLTRLVAGIRRTVDRRRPGATLTAAVWRDPGRGYREYLQNGAAWLNAGLLDAVVPMAYTPKTELFQSEIAAWHEAAGNRRVIPGLGVYLHRNPRPMRTQLDLCESWGGDFALFAYAALFAADGDRRLDKKGRGAQQRLRLMRRNVLNEFTPG